MESLATFVMNTKGNIMEYINICVYFSIKGKVKVINNV